MKRRAKISVILLVILFTLSSCTSLSNYFKAVPAYDQKSYESFTYMKADILMFYDTLNKPIDEAKYYDFIVRFNRMKEYESGKKGNEEIVNELEIVRRMYDRTCSDVRKSPYNQTMIDNRKETISMAFDVLIATEYSKKK